MRGSRCLLWGLALLLAARSGVAQFVKPELNVILKESSFWRVHTIWETEEVYFPNQKTLHAEVSTSGTDFSWKNPGDGKEWKFSAVTVPVIRLPAKNDSDWMKPDYDDSSWARLRGPFFANSGNQNWKLIQLRGLFTVEELSRAGVLKLNMTFRGGVVVYLNGEEVTRAFMPEGPVDTTTPALPYPQDVYFSAKGEYLGRNSYKVSQETLDVQAKRLRTITDVTIPNKMMRDGVNVLAVAIHRAPVDFAARFYAREDGSAQRFWTKAGVSKLEVIGQPGVAIIQNVGPAPDRVVKGAVQLNTGPLKGLGFHLRNQSVIQRVFLDDYPDAYSPLRPLSLTGVRNGIFAAQFLVGHGQEELVDLKVKVSDLAGPGTIPGSAVHIRYGVLDGAPSARHARWFDSLDDAPPESIPMYKEHGAALLPVWLEVDVPGDAKPGDYAGTVTVSAQHEKPLTLPLRLRVMDWTLPDAKNYAGMLDLVQSPETVAMAYDVPMWSEKHMKLLDRTFRLMSRMGAKTLYVTAIRRTHLGNEHAMVRWVRGEDGEVKPDFTVVEKYLDAALKHMGQIPAVILYAWEPPESQGHAGGAGGAARTHDKRVLYTVVDPATGALSERIGPAWGTEEAREFWKKLTDGLIPVLKKRGLEQSLVFGLVGDHRPTKQAMDDISNGVPGAKWAVHSHYYVDKWQEYPMGLTVALWGVGYTPSDPAKGLSFGWSNPHQLCYYPREMSLGSSTPVEFRVKMENYVGAIRGRGGFQVGSGVRGLGRLGADFWELKDDRGRSRGTLAGRYPEAAWGQLSLNFGLPRVIGMGKRGPVPTIRSEAFREAVQELEARAYIEKALLDDEAPTRLGAELSARCRTMLDERIRIYLEAGGEGEAWFISSGWRDRAEQLFGLAAEISGKYGDKKPNPNLTPRKP